eukprot:403332432
MKLKFLHLIVFDVTNVILCGLNAFYVGIAINISVAVFHSLVFSVDFIFRKKGLKKHKKFSQTFFEITYWASSYLIMMAFLLYLCNLFKFPSGLYDTFPTQCLGQFFEENEPIQTVCSRLTNKDAYNLVPSDETPVGFTTQNDLTQDIKLWLENIQQKHYKLLSEQDEIQLSQDLIDIRLKSKKYMLLTKNRPKRLWKQ